VSERVSCLILLPLFGWWEQHPVSSNNSQKFTFGEQP